MNWQDHVRQHADNLGRETYLSEFGMGIEFPDGCDAFWILPGEPMSTVPISPSGPDDIVALLRQYDQIGLLRKQVVHVVQHHFAEKNAELHMSPSGDWSFDCGSLSGVVDVGPPLTHATLQSKTVDEAIDCWQAGYWLGKRPSARRVQRYLNTPQVPQSVVLTEPHPDEDSSIADVLGWMGVCNVLQNPECLVDRNKAVALAQNPGRIGQVLQRVAERLPDASAACDLAKPGALCIDFSDDKDSFDIDTRSRELAKRLRGISPQVVGDKLADEYLRLDAARAKVLSAIWTAAANRGWGVENIGLPLFGIQPTVFLGKETREVGLVVDETLTNLLRDGTPESALEQILAEHDDFRRECLAVVDQDNKVSESALPSVSLRPASLPAPVSLSKLDAEVIAQMDRYAEQAIKECFQAENAIWEYSRYYHSERDAAWLPKSRWLQLAESRLKLDYPGALAILILLDHGDPRGDQQARRLLSMIEDCHDEQEDETIEIIWRYRKEFPEVAASWLGQNSIDCYDEVRASLGDPVAQRRLEREDVDEEEPDARYMRRLSAEKREQCHSDLVAWARHEHRCSPLDASQLQLAGEMGWHDVFDALQENPFLLPGWLTADERPDCFDEPGLLICGDALLAWSAYAPSPFLARIAATAANTDLVALAVQVQERDLERNPELQDSVRLSRDICETWNESLKFAIAITWNRCRSLIG